MNSKTNVANQHQKLADFHDKMEAIIASMPKSEKKPPFAPDFPDGSKLIPFTGYYSMETGLGSGAFFSIDTTEHYSDSPILPYYAAIEFNVSMNGVTTTTYQFDSNTEFDGTMLNIPGVLNLVFTREYDEGKLTSFVGTIGPTTVSGFTRFNPVGLESFVGNYKLVNPLTGNEALSIISDKNISFDYGAGTGILTPVFSYSYVPSMYVIMFSDASANKYTLMLGTASQMGLAVSIQESPGSDRFAVTIP